MNTRYPLICAMLAARLATAAPPDIEVEVRFIEIGETMPEPAGISWQLDSALSQMLDPDSTTNALPAVLASLAHSGNADLLCAPKIRTQSGTNATIKVVSEYRYPTEIDIRRVSVTNGTDIIHGIAIVPCNFTTRDVGITLSVTPFVDAQRDMIDLNLTAEVVSEPIWKEYTASYEGTDGAKQSIAFPQPFFHTRKITPNLSLRNGSTVLIGGMITVGTKRQEDRVPVLGAIPWLGRLFRSSHEIRERRHLLIAVTARTVEESR